MPSLFACFGLKGRRSGSPRTTTADPVHSNDTSFFRRLKFLKKPPCLNKMTQYITPFQLGKSFYEIDQYRATLQRLDNGITMVDEMVEMIVDRKTIEEEYQQRLIAFSERWNGVLSHLPDYGSNKASMFGMLIATDKEAEIRSEVAQQLQGNIVDYIKDWRSRIFSNSRIAKIRDSCKRRFERETQAWQKLCKKIEQCKILYQDSCVRLRNGEAFRQIVESDSGTTEETKDKLKQQVEDLRCKCIRYREDYRNSLKDATDKRDMFVQNMNDIFKKCEEIESERLMMFKEVLEKYSDLVIPPQAELNNLRHNFKKCIAGHDAGSDLEWWSDTYGPGTYKLARWPDFEDVAIC